MATQASDFILDVRRAARLVHKPIVTTDSQLIDPTMISKALQRAATWLTPKILETYDPAAFKTWPGELQEELRDAVNEFRTVAANVPSDKPATTPLFQEGVRAFDRLQTAVQKVVRIEWENAANSLISKVESWAKEFGWFPRRETKMLSETLIGDYSLDRLYMYAEGNLFILDPLARFIPGGLGAFDLSIQPSFYITSIYRDTQGEWFVHLDVGQGGHNAKKERLTKETFRTAVNELRSLI